MNYKKIGAGLAVFAVVALAGSALVSAATPESTFKGLGNKPNNEFRGQMEKASESGSFQTFKTLIGTDNRMANVVTEENFDKFVQMHSLMEDGKFEEAGDIRQELGLGNGQRGAGNRGMHQGQGQRSGFADSNGDGLCDNSDVK